MKDWKHEAMKYRDLDEAIMAQLEAEDAVEYLKIHHRFPEALSTRARVYLEEHQAELTRGLPARNELERESGRRTY